MGISGDREGDVHVWLDKKLEIYTKCILKKTYFHKLKLFENLLCAEVNFKNAYLFSKHRKP